MNTVKTSRSKKSKDKYEFKIKQIKETIIYTNGLVDKEKTKLYIKTEVTKLNKKKKIAIKNHIKDNKNYKRSKYKKGDNIFKKNETVVISSFKAFKNNLKQDESIHEK